MDLIAKMASPRRKRFLAGSAAVSALMATAGAAFAQGAEVSEIVVTAQKREQSIMDVGVAVTALSGEQLRDQGLQNFAAVADQVPNFTVSLARGAIPDFNIRGVSGDANLSRLNESSVAVYVDDVYLGDETALAGQTFDVQRVEVLRGPQGTLFGRNTTGGLVHYISSRPTAEPTGYGNAQYGSDNWVVLEGAVSGPLSDKVRGRLAGKWNRHDGHRENINKTPGADQKLGAENTWGVRGTLEVDVADNVLMTLIGSYSKGDGEAVPGNSYGALRPDGSRNPADWPNAFCSLGQTLDAKCVSTFSPLGPITSRKAGQGNTELSGEDLELRQEFYSLTAKFEVDLDWATLTSVTNYSHNDFHYEIDGDNGLHTAEFGPGIVQYVSLDNTAKQLSQEVRLNGSTETFDWVTGLYFYTDDKSYQKLDTLVLPTSRLTLNDAGVETKSYAMFGQINAHISDEVSLVAGVRYNKESRELTRGIYANLSTGEVQNVRAALPESKLDTRDLTGKFGVEWAPGDNHLWYASYSRGAKSGGFNATWNPGTLQANVNLTGPVGQETLDAFEIGGKHQLLGNKLRVSGAAFLYLYQGKQQSVTSFNPQTLVASSVFINSGDAEMRGAELEIAYTPNKRWDFTLGGGLLDTKIVDSNVVVRDHRAPVLGIPLKGLELTQAPKWTANAVVAHHLPLGGAGTLTLQSEANARSKIHYSITNHPLAMDEVKLVVNFRVMWRSQDERFSAQAFVTNAFNRKYLLLNRDAVFGNFGANNSFEGEPRLWGVKFGATF
ncbi:TonB-dependent receptor [Rhizorhabdus dicambivorans]|uniref:TonB-dependent receptor n=1 Tax=Rhizorhabdus dicambivorans TaxID=1850238 RepID=A0A2A4G0J4_9SPHN|nr:TonB-dependent receptor [Rhizorhabdus dicambivorans]PCE43996.1 TonB-dependent receptor [Rhizorhabdus dicambivorans]